MKNLLVANYRPHGRTTEKDLRNLVEAQLENSLAVGWETKDIVVVTNLDFDAPITLVRAPLNESCLTGSKMFALEHLFHLGLVKEGEMWWAHDLDAWQNFWFDEPEIADIGLTEYSKPNFNGGSIFLRASAQDLVLAITEHIRRSRLHREEPALDQVLRLPLHTGRVSVLNSTYNVGCSAYATRYQRSKSPILVSHFHPSGISWRTHVWGWNKINTPSVSSRLVELLVRRFHRGIAPVPEASDLKRHSNPRHYRLRESFHLGDSWARLNFALRLLEQGEEFPIYLPSQVAKEIFDLLDIGSLQPRFLAAKRKPDKESRRLFERIDTGSAAYSCVYFPTKIRHRPEGRIIGYAFDAKWNAEKKIPPKIDGILSALRGALPTFTFQAIGQPHQASVVAVVSALAQLQLLISVDNGIAHIARSMGLPLFLLEHQFPVSRGFPLGKCAFTKVSAREAVGKIVEHLTNSEAPVTERHHRDTEAPANRCKSRTFTP